MAFSCGTVEFPILSFPIACRTAFAEECTCVAQRDVFLCFVENSFVVLTGERVQTIYPSPTDTQQVVFLSQSSWKLAFDCRLFNVSSTTTITISHSSAEQSFSILAPEFFMRLFDHVDKSDAIVRRIKNKN